MRIRPRGRTGTRSRRSARYNIKIDTNGDARPDVIYRFRFAADDRPALPRQHRPDVRSMTAERPPVVAAGRRRRTTSARARRRTTGSLVAKSIVVERRRHEVFAGQRDDAFFGDIGAIFDLVAIRKGTGQHGRRQGLLRRLRRPRDRAADPDRRTSTAKNGTIGVWASTDRRKVTTSTASSHAAAGRRSSRLGNPLVNEVVIPTALKDALERARRPWTTGSSGQYYTTPILAAVINKLYKLERARDRP